MALRDHLRADEDVDLAGGEPPQQGRDRAAAADGVAIDAGDARAREERGDLVLDPLGAESDVLEILPGAVHARRRNPHRVVAVVAPRPPCRLVNRQRHAAVGTVERLAALAAEHARREAAAVEQHHRLLPPSEPLLDRRRERPADDHVGTGIRILLPHVDDRHGRHRAVEDALLERDQLVAAVLRVVEALERRRGGAEHGQRAARPRAHHRHVAAVVARALLLLVRPVVLLVHDDQAEALNGREDRRARADDDVDLRAADAMPLIVALAVGQAAVLDGHAIAEQRPERSGDGRRERDFRHEDDDAPAGSRHFARQPEIQLRLAAAGHAVEQGRRERSGLRQAREPVERRRAVQP